MVTPHAFFSIPLTQYMKTLNLLGVSKNMRKTPQNMGFKNNLLTFLISVKRRTRVLNHKRKNYFSKYVLLFVKNIYLGAVKFPSPLGSGSLLSASDPALPLHKSTCSTLCFARAVSVSPARQ